MRDHRAPEVLLLEDDAADALLIEEALDRGLPGARITRAANRRQYLDRLSTAPVDVVLSDGSVPGCGGLDAFHLAREHHPLVPFLIVSGAGAIVDRRELQGAGISATVSKDSLDDLGPAVVLALAGDGPELDPDRLRTGYELLLVVAGQLARADDAASVRELACATARRLTGADGSTFVVREGEYCRHVTENPTPAADSPRAGPAGRRFAVRDCISGWTMLRRQPAVVDEVDEDPRMSGPSGTEYRSTTARSVVVVPIGTDRPAAALTVYWTEPHPPDVTGVRLLTALAALLASSAAAARATAALTARAREATAELDGLSYAVSHDLRAPIRHLSGFTRILMTEAPDLDPQTRHVAQRIRDAADQLRAMVDGLLALSRTSRAEIDRRPVDLAVMARDVVLRLEHEATAAGPDPARPAVEFVAPEQLPVSGDPKLLTTMLQQLLANGWKFTVGVPRPRVELGVRPDWPDTGAEPGSEPVAGPVYFVQDNGAGFETGSSERLFGAFQRLHAVDEFPGIGMGLVTAQRIIAKHGGVIRATGAPGQGATFCFTLPD